MEEKIDKFIEENPDWYVEDGCLVAGFEFKSFDAVKPVVSRIMNLAEKLDHHPEVAFGYKTIEVKTVTHEAGNQITEKDFELAEKISEIISAG